MTKTLNQLTEITTLADDDLLLARDTSAVEDKKISAEDARAYMQTLENGETVEEAVNQNSADIGQRVVRLSSVAESISGLSGSDGQVFYVSGWHDGSDIGKQTLTYRSDWPKSEHGVTGWSPTVPAVSEQSGADLGERTKAYLAGTGETDSAGMGGFVIGEADGYFRCSKFGLLSGQVSLDEVLDNVVSQGLVSTVIVDEDCIVGAAVETDAPLVFFVKPGITVDVETNDGIFNVNEAPFLFYGKETQINHQSRVLFFGNDASKIFNGITISGINFSKTSVNTRSTLYFPNTETQNVLIENIKAEDVAGGSEAKFIDVDWNTGGSDTKDWDINDLKVTGYLEGFHSQGTGFARGLRIRNYESRGSYGRPFRNYHWQESDLDLRIYENTSAAYVWGGTLRKADILVKDSVDVGVILEQIQGYARVKTIDCGSFGAHLTWGSQNCMVDFINSGGTTAVNLEITDNAASSEIRNCDLRIISREHSSSPLRIIGTPVASAEIGEVSIYLDLKNASGSPDAVLGRELRPPNKFIFYGGSIDNSHAFAFDMRSVGPGSEDYDALVRNMTLRCPDIVRSDRSGGLFLIKDCVIDDTGKLSSWAGLSVPNYFSNCWDETTNSNQSG